MGLSVGFFLDQLARLTVRLLRLFHRRVTAILFRKLRL